MATSGLRGNGYFATTQWSVVLEARDSDESGAAAALQALCQSYWFPLYAFIRRRGYSHEDAADLTQSFFGRFLEKNYLASVDREKGRFRSFLLSSVKHFLSDEWDKTQARKRGGGTVSVSLDERLAANRYDAELMEDASPDKLFERRWAVAVIERTVDRLRDEWKAAEKSEEFETLKTFLTGHQPEVSYADAAARLGISVAAATSAIHRLRRRYRALIRDEIAQTVAHPSEIDDELNHLMRVLSG